LLELESDHQWLGLIPKRIAPTYMDGTILAHSQERNHRRWFKEKVWMWLLAKLKKRIEMGKCPKWLRFQPSYRSASKTMTLMQVKTPGLGMWCMVFLLMLVE